jgi:hypothetical protein
LFSLRKTEKKREREKEMGTSDVINKVRRNGWIQFGLLSAMVVGLLIVSFVLLGRSTRDEKQSLPMVRVCLVNTTDPNGPNFYTLPFGPISTLNQTPFPFNTVVYDRFKRYSKSSNMYNFEHDGPYSVNIHLSFRLGWEPEETLVTIWRSHDGVLEALKTEHLGNSGSSTNEHFMSVDISAKWYFDNNDYAFISIQNNNTETLLDGSFDCGSNFMEIYDMRL